MRIRISLVTLGDPTKTTGGYLYHARMAEAAASHDSVLGFVSFPERPFPLPVLASRSIAARLRRRVPHAVVVDSIAAAYLAPSVVRGGLGVPLIGMLHQPPGGIDAGRLHRAVRARLDRLTYARAAHLLLASESLEPLLRRPPLDAIPRTVAAPGRDVAAPDHSPGHDLRMGRRIAALCIGNWVPRKGILDLLKAVDRTPADSVTLHLVGDTAANRRYERLVRSRLEAESLKARVVVHGQLPREEVAALYRKADVFVLPSTQEPYGTVYGEALASGIPVVGWDAGNLPFLAFDGREGFVLPVGDVAGLAAAIARLAEDEDLRNEMGRRARATAQKLPTWEETAQLFFASIRRVVEQAR